MEKDGLSAQEIAKNLKETQRSGLGTLEIVDELSIDFSISVLNGIKGTAIEADMLPAGVEGFDEWEPQNKGSRFWLQLQFNGETLESEKKYWASDFVIENGIGKCDFGFEKRFEFNPSTQLRDQLRSNLFIELWEL